MSSVTVDNLRPVEMLWLEYWNDDAEWEREESLRAVLMDLAVRGLLEPEDEGDAEAFEPTGSDADEPLREYERELLEAIEGDDDEQAMVDAVYEFSFEQFFIDAGVLAVEEKSETVGLPFIPKSWLSWTKEWEEVVPGERYDEFMSVVRDARRNARRLVENNEIPVDMLPVLFAFPYTTWFETVDMDALDSMVVDSVDELELDVDEMGANVSGMTTATAAAVAASSASACASASASCAASASSACAAGASGGAAAGAAGAV